MPSAPDSSASESSSPARPSIPKWPFIIADAVLILVALALSSTATVLSEMQMVFCLGAVGLGGILLVTPFALEVFPPMNWSIFSGRASARGAGPDGLTESELRRQARAAAEAVEHAARANAALETSARRFDARFAPLAEVQKGLEAAVAELREATTARQAATGAEAQAVQREFDRLRKDHAEKFKATEMKITALEETLAVIASHLKTLAERPAVVASAASAPVAAPARPRHKPAPVAAESPAPVPVEEPALAVVGVVVADAPSLGSIALSETSPVENFASAPVEESPAEKMPEAPDSMLAKALATAQPAAESPAVAGIIQSRPRRSRKSKPHLPLDTLSAPVAMEAPAMEAGQAEPTAPEASAEAAPAEPVAEAESVAAVTETPAAPKVEPAPVVSVEETASSIRRTARAKAIALRGDDEDEKKVTPTIFTPPPTETEAAKADGPTQGELLAREADTIRRKRATKSPLHLATLTARVLIGIGNKPFVRGEGPGLSADKGVPMEFVEIGQWRWVAPKDSSHPITLRILKNDEVPAEGEPIVLKPGQSLDVSPVFPA
jgi:hypothetical protein